MDDVKKNRSMLYLNMVFRASRQAKDAPYFVPSMRKTDGVKSSTNNDRTRIPSGRCKSYVTSNVKHRHPVNNTRLIFRILYEHLTTLYLIWSPVPEQVLRVLQPLCSG